MKSWVPCLIACVASLVCCRVASAQTPPTAAEGMFASDALRPSGAGGNLACLKATQYAVLTNGGQYDQLGSLFAADAAYYGARLDPIVGADKIGAFYATYLAKVKPHIQITSLVPAGPADCLLGLRGTTANATQKPVAAIDHFTIDNAGMISRLFTYYRPDAFQALSAAATPAPDK